MRILTRQLHRAFPELDRYSDAQCRAFMKRLEQRWVVHGATLLGSAAVGIACFLVAVVIVAGPGARGWSDDLVVEAIRLGMPLIAGFGAMLITRDLLVRASLRRRVLNEFNRLSCANCGHCLIGQRARGRTVHCPECGRPTSFTELGINDASELCAEFPPAESPSTESTRAESTDVTEPAALPDSDDRQ